MALVLVPLLICPVNNVKLTLREAACALDALFRAAQLLFTRKVGQGRYWSWFTPSRTTHPTRGSQV